jgi:hypothetical protein
MWKRWCEGELPHEVKPPAAPAGAAAAMIAAHVSAAASNRFMCG